MRYRILAFLFSLICLFVTQSQAEEFEFIPAQSLMEDKIVSIEQKIYVEPSQIYFSMGRIFVQTPKGLTQIHELNSDDLGIYYRTEHPKSWYCKYKYPNGKVCGHYNTYTYFCEECGHAPDEI
jgi:hypothetical protein